MVHFPLPLSRSSRLLRLQIRTVRPRPGGAALPVPAGEREPRLPQENQEGEETHSQRNRPPSGHRPNVLQACRALYARVNIQLKSTCYSLIYFAGC